MSSVVMNGMNIPEEAIVQLGYCSTAEDVKMLGQMYGITLTDELASALITDDAGQVSELCGCGGSQPADTSAPAEYNIVLNADGKLACCPYCGGDNYVVDCYINCDTYACDHCGREYEHVVGDTDRIYEIF